MGFGANLRSLAEVLIRASRQVKRLVLKTRKGVLVFPERREGGYVRVISSALGVEPVEKGILEENVRIWVWESGENAAFVWHEPTVMLDQI